jgi:hypothetical protein
MMSIFGTNDYFVGYWFIKWERADWLAGLSKQPGGDYDLLFRWWYLGAEKKDWHMMTASSGENQITESLAIELATDMFNTVRLGCCDALGDPVDTDWVLVRDSPEEAVKILLSKPYAHSALLSAGSIDKLN